MNKIIWIWMTSEENSSISWKVTKEKLSITSRDTHTYFNLHHHQKLCDLCITAHIVLANHRAHLLSRVGCISTSSLQDTHWTASDMTMYCIFIVLFLLFFFSLFVNSFFAGADKCDDLIYEKLHICSFVENV